MQPQSANLVPAPDRLAFLEDDHQLLVRCAGEDRDAFTALFQRHRDGLQGFLFRKLRSHEDAEDAVTLTFCKAWRARASFRGNASGKAWLYRIATRVALDMLRCRRRRAVEQELDARSPDTLEISEPGPMDPMDLVLRTEYVAGTRRAVSEAVTRLPLAERRLLELFYFEGHNYEDIAELTGISRSQVRGRLHRIRARVRRDLVDRQQWQPA
jgi:RNA polymerase sigma-70 factor (ECF subfamily)